MFAGFLGGEGRSKEFDPSLHIRRTGMEVRKLLSGASMVGFSLMSLILLLEVHGGERYFLLLVCSAGVCLVGRRCVTPGGLIRYHRGGGIRLASLKEWEAADEIQLPALGIAARMKTALERSPPTNKSLLFLCRGL